MFDGLRFGFLNNLLCKIIDLVVIVVNFVGVVVVELLLL